LRSRYTLEGDQAARHAFRVARRNSMVLGEEPQILGRPDMKRRGCVRSAGGAIRLMTLHQLFNSFAVAKEVPQQH
jgi:glutamyl-tRNA reductase